MFFHEHEQKHNRWNDTGRRVQGFCQELKRKYDCADDETKKRVWTAFIVTFLAILFSMKIGKKIRRHHIHRMAR